VPLPRSEASAAESGADPDPRPQPAGQGNLEGGRIPSGMLPLQSPWLSPIEPKWIHTKRKVVAATRLLTGQELTERVYTAFNHPHEDPLAIPDKVA
jgi:hypothetical protein